MSLVFKDVTKEYGKKIWHSSLQSVVVHLAELEDGWSLLVVRSLSNAIPGKVIITASAQRGGITNPYAEMRDVTDDEMTEVAKLVATEHPKLPYTGVLNQVRYLSNHPLAINK